MTEMPLESPSEDVAEQRTEAYPDQPRPAVIGGGESALEADPADARDQAEELPLDEDEWQ